MQDNGPSLAQHLREAGCLPYKHLDNFGLCPGYYYFSRRGYVDTLVFSERLPLYQKLARISHTALRNLETSVSLSIPSDSLENVYEHSLRESLEISKKQTV